MFYTIAFAKKNYYEILAPEKNTLPRICASIYIIILRKINWN